MKTDEEPFTCIEPTEAWSMMQSDPSVLLIDVRSDMEFLMIGHPEGAVNIPLIDAPNWTVDDGFVAKVRKALLGRVASRDRRAPALLLICRSGNRSRDAALLLASEGMIPIFVVNGGFEGPLDDKHHRNSLAGWRFDGLPWVQC